MQCHDAGARSLGCEGAGMGGVRMQQLAGSVLAVIFIDLGFRVWIVNAPRHPALVLLSIAAYLCAFVAVRGVFDAPRRWLEIVYPVLCLVGVLVGFAAQGVHSDVIGGYASDALAFDHYSAQLLLSGRDPYGADMTPAYAAFHVPRSMVTPTTSGGTVTVQSYPALAFLVYAPFVLAHVGSMLWVNVALLFVAILLAYALVPPENRIAIGLIVVAVQEFVYFATGAVTDIVWVVPMIAVAALWDESPEWAAVWFGVACAIKQDAWFVVPFALLHWRSTRTAGILAAAFLIPNLPFIIWNPQAWVMGVLAPLVTHPVPFGSGFVQLLASGLLPASAALLALPWILAFLLCLYLYVRDAAKYHWLPFIAPAVVLFFAPRSLANYFLYWPLIAIVYASARLHRQGDPSFPERRRSEGGV